MSEPAKPGMLDRLRARYAWFDHAMRANDWFDENQGNFYAAGLTYYTIFALFPLLMVGFSAVGFLLSRRPDLLSAIDNKVMAAVPGALGQQMLELMNSAIDARASVGVIGLTVAVWVGLNWIEQSSRRVDPNVAAGRRFERLPSHQGFRSGCNGVVVPGHFRHPCAQRPGGSGADGSSCCGGWV